MTIINREKSGSYCGDINREEFGSYYGDYEKSKIEASAVT